MELKALKILFCLNDSCCKIFSFIQSTGNIVLEIVSSTYA
jgi:hypothetical protein